MSQALSKKKKHTCNVARSGCYPDVAGPTLHGQSHQQMHALLWNQEPLSKTRSRDPVFTPVLIPNTYLYPWLIKSGTQNNLTNGVCVYVYMCAHMCMSVCSHQSTGSCSFPSFSFKNYLLATAQRTLLNVKWQPGWEGSLGENGCVYIYGWVPLLSTWNYHNTVNWLYSNMK